MSQRDQFSSADIKVGFVAAVIALPFVLGLAAWVADTSFVQNVTEGSRWSVLKGVVVVLELVVFAIAAGASQARRRR